MNEKKRITANLPSDLLEEASKVTQKGITETLVQGLQMISRSRAYALAQSLKGKVHFDIDIDVSRERKL